MMALRLNKLFVIVFAMVISVHLISSILPIEPNILLTENRPIKGMPTFEGSYTKFIKEYELYFNDHFGFRNFFVYSSNFFLVKIFNISSSEKVIIGKNKWLFFAGEDNAFHFREREIESKVLDTYLQNYAYWLRKLSITKTPFIFLVAPDKQTIYPEFLPEPQISWLKYKNYDMIAKALDEKDKSVFINVKENLLHLKLENKKLYFKADSHWNDTAAFSVYSNVMERLTKVQSLKNIPVLKQNQLKVLNRIYTGDMIRIFWGIANLYDEYENFLICPNKEFIKFVSQKDEFNGIKITNEFYTSINIRLSSQNKTLIVVRDSQFIPLMPMFAESFNRVIFINVWEDRNAIERIIDQEKPDAVIFESVERGLVRFLEKL